jgi:pimeloyl-ACP methyl ester carboxylesterase
MKRSTKLVVGVLGMLVVALVAGAAYQAVATARDEAMQPMPGKRVDIGGRYLHLHCSGEGPHTLILEAGLGNSSASWMQVQRRAARFTRVCSYDRAGLGWSDPTTGPLTTDQVVDDLRALLQAASVPGPHVLAGWSAGGLFLRSYVQRYPADVAGLVLIESSHEQQGNRHWALPGTDSMLATLDICRRLAWTGVVRLSGAMDMVTQGLPLPEEQRTAMLAHANRRGFCAGIQREIGGFTSQVVAAEGPSTLEDLPLLVITRGRPVSAEDFRGLDATIDNEAEMQEAWAAMQAELAVLSTNATRVVVPDAGHMLPLEAPDAVTEALAGFLATL